ncbi:MAG: hypothetical protein ACTSQG_09255, partial [Promethearchaeota archaeon]
MSSREIINLKSFPKIKVISSILFVIGAILVYILASKPEYMLFQIGGIPLNLILGIFPLISGLILIIYAFITNYNASITYNNDKITVKGRKNQITIDKDDIKAVRVRDAGKFTIWFVFFFINFYFVYYGIECALYFSANHNAGLLEFIILPMFMIWIGGLLLILFPRKLIIILTRDKAIIQKINYLPRDGSFEQLFNKIFGFEITEDIQFVKSYHFIYRLTLGVIFFSIFIITSMLVNIDGINQPLHDLGIFIPIFLLLFSVLMLSSSIKEGFKQKIFIKENKMRLEEITLINSITGKNFCWIKAKEKIDESKAFSKGFRTLNRYNLMLLFIIFGQAFFLAYKFIWLPTVYLDYIDWRDVLVGTIMLIVLFLYAFEVVIKFEIDIDSDFKFIREILIFNQKDKESMIREHKLFRIIKNKMRDAYKDFKECFK